LRKSLFVGASLLVGVNPALAATWTGKASYYGLHGRTASGAHVGNMTAAHRTLPFGTSLKVTNLHNGRTVVVRVNNRGPFIRGRIIDVSTPAADALGFRRAGVANVRVDLVEN
jgi:rare lipoprotein A